jgi:hypothetical protein
MQKNKFMFKSIINNAAHSQNYINMSFKKIDDFYRDFFPGSSSSTAIFMTFATCTSFALFCSSFIMPLIPISVGTIFGIGGVLSSSFFTTTLIAGKAIDAINNVVDIRAQHRAEEIIQREKKSIIAVELKSPAISLDSNNSPASSINASISAIIKIKEKLIELQTQLNIHTRNLQLSGFSSSSELSKQNLILRTEEIGNTLSGKHVNHTYLPSVSQSLSSQDNTPFFRHNNETKETLSSSNSYMEKLKLESPMREYSR